MPITRSAFVKEDPMDAIDREEVLLAKMQSAETIFSKEENTECLTSIFSTIASMIK